MPKLLLEAKAYEPVGEKMLSSTDQTTRAQALDFLAAWLGGAGSDEAMLTAKLVEVGLASKLMTMIKGEPATDRSDIRRASHVLGSLSCTKVGKDACVELLQNSATGLLIADLAGTEHGRTAICDAGILDRIGEYIAAALKAGEHTPQWSARLEATLGALQELAGGNSAAVKAVEKLLPHLMRMLKQLVTHANDTLVCLLEIVQQVADNAGTSGLKVLKEEGIFGLLPGIATTALASGVFWDRVSRPISGLLKNALRDEQTAANAKQTIVNIVHAMPAGLDQHDPSMAEVHKALLQLNACGRIEEVALALMEAGLQDKLMHYVFHSGEDAELRNLMLEQASALLSGLLQRPEGFKDARKSGMLAKVLTALKRCSRGEVGHFLFLLNPWISNDDDSACDEFVAARGFEELEPVLRAGPALGDYTYGSAVFCLQYFGSTLPKDAAALSARRESAACRIAIGWLARGRVQAHEYSLGRTMFLLSAVATLQSVEGRTAVRNILASLPLGVAEASKALVNLQTIIGGMTEALDVVAEEGIAQPLVDLLNDPGKKQLHDQSLELLCVLARTHPTKAKIAAPACAERVQKAIKEKRDIQDVRPGDEDPRSHTEPSVVLSALAKDSRTAANAIDAAVKKMTEDDNVRRHAILEPPLASAQNIHVASSC